MLKSDGFSHQPPPCIVPPRDYAKMMICPQTIRDAFNDFAECIVDILALPIDFLQS